MDRWFSRRKFLTGAAAAAAVSISRSALASTPQVTPPASTSATERIVDMHVHFDETNPNFVRDLVKVIEPLNITACVLTPYANRQVIATAAYQYPARIIPFGSLDLDAPDALRQAQEFHALGYRGLGELEFVKKPFTDASYMQIYELANQYGWVVLFHTGIVLRVKFDEPEDVASYRMRAFHLEEIARRFPRITVLGAHCGNPEYEWAGEVARWNPNVFFDLSGSSLTKMQDRLAELRKVFWWTGTKWKTKTPEDDPNAFVKLVFGSDEGLDGIAPALAQYRAMFKACDIPPRTQKLILGGTLAKILGLPE
jgi:uncharacterized protein